MLTLEGEGLPDGEGVSGDVFSTRGELLSLSEGRVHVDGLPLDPARAEAADEVRNIELEIDPVAFWAIHEPTGTALAIVDGGGGAQQRR